MNANDNHIPVGWVVGTFSVAPYLRVIAWYTQPRTRGQTAGGPMFLRRNDAIRCMEWKYGWSIDLVHCRLNPSG